MTSNATTVYNYRLYCNTESCNVTVWNTVAPTVCPNNNTHSINSNSLTIIGQVNSQFVTIKEESTPTGGNFGSTTIVFNANANTSTDKIVYWPYPISSMETKFFVNSENIGDSVDILIAPNLKIGIITAPFTMPTAWTSQNYTVGNTVTYTHPLFGSIVYTCILNTVNNELPINTVYWQQGFQLSVNSTVLQYINVGYHINLNDNITINQNLGRVIYINNTTQKIYVELAPSVNFDGSTLLLVSMTIYIIKDFYLGINDIVAIGQKKIGGTYVPANLIIVVRYHNTTNVNKKFSGSVDYTY